MKSGWLWIDDRIAIPRAIEDANIEDANIEDANIHYTSYLGSWGMTGMAISAWRPYM